MRFTLRFFFIFIFFLSLCKYQYAQKDTATFNRKKEVVFDNKRYRVYNSWLSAGAGISYNTKWPKDERNTGVDFSFYIKDQIFRIGAFASGADFHAINNYNLHLCYGYRKESGKFNVSAFLGPSYSYFKRPLKDSLDYDLSKTYNAFGVYAVIEGVYKVKYDIGIGAQLFCDYNPKQMIYGVRFIAYFSGAYRGLKRGYRAPNKNR